MCDITFMFQLLKYLDPIQNLLYYWDWQVNGDSSKNGCYKSYQKLGHSHGFSWTWESFRRNNFHTVWNVWCRDGWTQGLTDVLCDCCTTMPSASVLLVRLGHRCWCIVLFTDFCVTFLSCTLTTRARRHSYRSMVRSTERCCAWFQVCVRTPSHWRMQWLNYTSCHRSVELGSLSIRVQYSSKCIAKYVNLNEIYQTKVVLGNLREFLAWTD